MLYVMLDAIKFFCIYVPALFIGTIIRSLMLVMVAAKENRHLEPEPEVEIIVETLSEKLEKMLNM